MTHEEIFYYIGGVSQQLEEDERPHAASEGHTRRLLRSDTEGHEWRRYM